MALPSSVKRFSKELPFGLRVDLEGYLGSVEMAQGEIYAEAEISLKEVSRETFLLAAGVWHLWTYIDSQRWIIRNSLQLADDFGAESIQAGRFQLSKGSDDVVSVRRLHTAFGNWLRRNNFEFIVGIKDLKSLLFALAERDRNAG
jgi:hypothetical protein